MQRSILITGCSSGIGLASALMMKKRGWRVLATARKQEDLERIRSENGLETIALELADANSIAACAAEALHRTGGHLYALFNNAAYGQLGAIEDLTAQHLRHQLEVNLIGTHDLTRQIIPAMRKAGKGRIVQCSSVLGFVTGPYRGAYSASKYALEALSDAMRLELEGSGIHVSIIEPGPIRTRFLENALARFLETIDVETSPHAEVYAARRAKMEQGGQTNFKLEPDIVARKLVHALESDRPKRRYLITTPTYIAAFMKRVAPAAAMDWLARST